MHPHAMQKLQETRRFNSLLKSVESNVYAMIHDGRPVDLDTLHHSIFLLANEAELLIKQDPLNRPWLANRAAKIYGFIGQTWEYSLRDGAKIDELQPEFQESLGYLLQVVGIPDDMSISRVIGISEEIDKKIVDFTIAYCMPADDLSSEYGFRALQAGSIIDERYSNLLGRLITAKRFDLAIDVMEAVKFLLTPTPEENVRSHFIDFATNAFFNPLDLTHEQQARFRGLFSSIEDGKEPIRDLSTNLYYLMNMIKSGLSDIASPIIAKGFKSIDYFQSIDPYTFLIDLENLSGMDVAPLLTHWADKHNSGREVGDALLVVVGYQLLNEHDSIQENLLEFSEDRNYQVISTLVGDRRITGGKSGYTVNQDHLRSLLSEFMAQRPGAIRDMGKDPVIGEIASKLPSWYVDKLETDLGL